MRTSYKLISALFAVALLAAPAAAQQSGKSGKYTGKFGGEAAGQAYELEKGHVFWVGMYHGVFFNDVAGGFLDKTEVTCPATSDSVNGVDTAARGYCIVTDKDGDKAFLVWQGKGTGAGSADAGTFQWTGGTGKFAGLQGNNTFGNGVFPISKTSGGWTIWEGEWRLP
jgi:hypothetical protein